MLHIVQQSIFDQARTEDNPTKPFSNPTFTVLN